VRGDKWVYHQINTINVSSFGGPPLANSSQPAVAFLIGKNYIKVGQAGLTRKFLTT